MAIAPNTTHEVSTATEVDQDPEEPVDTYLQRCNTSKVQNESNNAVQISGDLLPRSVYHKTSNSCRHSSIEQLFSSRILRIAFKLSKALVQVEATESTCVIKTDSFSLKGV